MAIKTPVGLTIYFLYPSLTTQTKEEGKAVSLKTDKFLQNSHDKVGDTTTMVLFVFVFGCGIKQTCGAQTAEQWFRLPRDQTNCNSPSFQTNAR